MRKVILPNLKSLLMFENKKILITGGSGFLGKNLVKKFNEKYNLEIYRDSAYNIILSDTTYNN